METIFIYNNTLTHTVYIVRKLLADLEITVIEQPLYSPDLNLIENIWSVLKGKIYEICPELCSKLLYNQETRELLITTAAEAWSQIDMGLFERLADSIPRRVKAIIEADRWYTKY